MLRIKIILVLMLHIILLNDVDVEGKTFNYQTFFNMSPYNDAIDLAIVNIITQAQATIDAHFYDIDRDVIVNAFLKAANNGVKIRIITDSDNWNASCDTLNSNPNINVINDLKTTGNDASSRQSHNKFAVFDYNYAGYSPVKNFVWTGSYNITDNGTLNNANNAILIMETNNATLAGAYTTEFNEMWGSTTFTFNAANSRFGSEKTDNTPHYFSLGSGISNIECYFSPSDSTASHIAAAVNSANYNIFFCIFTYTSGAGGHIIFTAMSNRKRAGVAIQGVFDSLQAGGAYSEYTPAVNQGWDVYKDAVSGLLHHKYMIIDYGHPSSDPVVITGSHNWTEAANTANDENTLIIHDNDVVNDYFKEFYDRFTEAGGTVIPFGPQFSDINVSPSSIYNDNSDGAILTVSVKITEPSSTNILAWLDMRKFGGTNYTLLYDDGTHGDTTADDDIYTRNLLFVNNTNLYDKNYIPLYATDGDLTNSTEASIIIKTRIPRILNISYTPLTNNGFTISTIKIKVRDDDSLYNQISLSANLSNFKDTNLILSDNGIAPDEIEGDKIFTFNLTTTNESGIYTIPIKLYDGLHTSYSNIPIRVIQDKIPPAEVSYFYLTSEYKKIILHLKTPSDRDLKGILIVMKSNDNYPVDISDGEKIINKLVDANSEYTFTLTNVRTGVRYYFSAFSYDIQKNYSLMATTDGLAIDYGDKDVIRMSDNYVDLSKQSKVELYLKNDLYENNGDIIKAEIYNINGVLISTIDNQENPGKLVWRLENEMGTKVGSGLYFIFIKTKLKIYKKRILIVR